MILCPDLNCLLVSAERLICLSSLEASHYIAYWGSLSLLDQYFPTMLVHRFCAFSTIQKTAGRTVDQEGAPGMSVRVDSETKAVKMYT